MSLDNVKSGKQEVLEPVQPSNKSQSKRKSNAAEKPLTKRNKKHQQQSKRMCHKPLETANLQIPHRHPGQILVKSVVPAVQRKILHRQRKRKKRRRKCIPLFEVFSCRNRPKKQQKSRLRLRPRHKDPCKDPGKLLISDTSAKERANDDSKSSAKKNKRVFLDAWITKGLVAGEKRVWLFCNAERDRMFCSSC